MKSKITRGAGFCGLVDYVFDIGKDATGDKDALKIGGNMAGDQPRELVAEFAALRRLRPDIERPVWHSSLRLPPQETITDEKWDKIAKDYLTRIGLCPDRHPYIVIRHNDSHIHIVSSRIAFNGSLYYGKNEHLIATRIVQQIEKDFNLTITKGPTYDKDGKIVMQDRSRITNDELKMSERTGNIVPRQRLQEIIVDSVKDRPTLAAFEKRLTEAGVSYRAGSNGYSYQFDGIAFKGSQLGQTFKWSQLQKCIILPEQEIIKEEHFRPQIDDEYHNNLFKQQSMYAARATAWEAEQKRRDKYRANRCIIYSVGRLSSDILPRPLGEAVMIAAETMILIARINDWRQAHIYKLEVERLKSKMNRVKTEQMKSAEKLADHQPVLNQNKPTYQQPEVIAFGPKRTATIILNMANRTTDTEQQAKFKRLADRVCMLPDDTIIYEGPKKPSFEEFMKAAVKAVNVERQQECNVQIAYPANSGEQNQRISHNKPVNINTPKGRRR